MERDEALLRKVGDVIAAEPERYNQREWFTFTECGTTACVAGHLVMAHPEFEEIVTQDCWPISGTVVVAGKKQHVHGVAGQLAGLTSDEQEVLFDPSWEPAGDLCAPLHERVQAALYALSEGASIGEVTA